MNTFAWLPEDVSEAIARAQALADQRGIAGADGLEIPIIEMTRTFTPAELLAQYEELACASDAIVTGHTSIWLHHLNSSRQGIYTDYDFVVDTVIKDNAKAPLSMSQHIVMARPGGSLQLGTSGTIKTIIISPGSFPHLETGSEYLIFLNFIPPSGGGGYQAADPFGSFIATGAQWTIMRKAYSALTLPEFSRDGFPPAITQWIASCKQ